MTDRLMSWVLLAGCALSFWMLVASVIKDVRRGRAARCEADADRERAEAERSGEPDGPDGATVTVATGTHRFVGDRNWPRVTLSEPVRSSAVFFPLDAPDDTSIRKYYLVRDANRKHDEIVRITGVTVSGPSWGRSGAEVQRGQGGTRAHRHPAGSVLIPLTAQQPLFREGLR